MIYQPAEDSLLLENAVKAHAKGKAVLDIGSGSGIQALAAEKAGAKSVLASDISPEAVKELQNKGINAVQSDMFDKINGKFDLIVCNPPYLPQDEREDKESSLITSGGKNGDEFIVRFLKQAIKHLSPKGEILIVLSSLTPRNKIESLLQKLKFEKTVLVSRKLSFETLEIWLIGKNKTAF